MPNPSAIALRAATCNGGWYCTSALTPYIADLELVLYIYSHTLHSKSTVFYCIVLYIYSRTLHTMQQNTLNLNCHCISILTPYIPVPGPPAIALRAAACNDGWYCISILTPYLANLLYSIA